jgi:hypothetical protein
MQKQHDLTAIMRALGDAQKYFQTAQDQMTFKQEIALESLADIKSTSNAIW